MKKIVMIVAVALISVASLSAQEEQRAVGTTNAKGVNLLPAAGDFSIGVDAAPFLRYAGGLLSNAGATAPTFQGTFAGQYFLTDKTSIRATLGLNLTSTSTKTLVDDVTSTDPDKTVTDVNKDGRTNITLGVDYLFHRGYGRLQAFYGGGLLIGYGSRTISNEYGNKITATYPVTRTLTNKSGSSFSAGLRGVLGVEYFIAPKISVGAEFNLALSFHSAPKGETVTEGWDLGDAKVKKTTTELYTGSGGSSMVVAPNTGLFLSFYF